MDIAEDVKGGMQFRSQIMRLDPKAVGILNDAAFHMGVHFARRNASTVAVTGITPGFTSEQVEAINRPTPSKEQPK